MADEFSRITDSQVFPVEPEHIERIEHRFLVTSAANEWRGFLARRRGGTDFGTRVKADRRDGELKMDWTKPPHDRSDYGY